MDDIVLGIYRSKVYENKNDYHGSFFQIMLNSNSINTFYHSCPTYESPSESHLPDRHLEGSLPFPILLLTITTFSSMVLLVLFWL